MRRISVGLDVLVAGFLALAGELGGANVSGKGGSRG